MFPPAFIVYGALDSAREVFRTSRLYQKPNNLLSDKNVAISNIAGYSAGYCNKIQYIRSPQDHQLMAIERTQRGHSAPGWSRTMSMSKARMDRGPRGTAHSLSEEAEQPYNRNFSPIKVYGQLFVLIKSF
jgi:hypothetical protein